MSVMNKARDTTYDTANVPLYDKESGCVCNLISVVEDNSILRFASKSRTTGYSDISGQTVEIEIHEDKKNADGKTIYDEEGHAVQDVGTAIVEIVKGDKAKIFFKFQDVVWSIPVGNCKLYKI